MQDTRMLLLEFRKEDYFHHMLSKIQIENPYGFSYFVKGSYLFLNPDLNIRTWIKITLVDRLSYYLHISY